MSLWQCLLLVAGFNALTRAWWPAFAATSLLVNWCICTTASEALGYQFHYMLLSAVDLATAAFLLLMPASRAQILLCVTYVVALCCHASFAVVGGNDVSEYYYWWALHYIAWSQFWITFFWGMYEAGRRAVGGSDHRSGVDAGGHLLHPLAGVTIRSGEDA